MIARSLSFGSTGLESFLQISPVEISKGEGGKVSQILAYSSCMGRCAAFKILLLWESWSAGALAFMCNDYMQVVLPVAWCSHLKITVMTECF